MYKTIHIPCHIMYVMQGMLKPALILPKSVDTSSFFPVISTLASTEVTFYSSLRTELCTTQKPATSQNDANTEGM